MTKIVSLLTTWLVRSRSPGREQPAETPTAPRLHPIEANLAHACAWGVPIAIFYEERTDPDMAVDG
jgi:hypothetical protein